MIYFTDETIDRLIKEDVPYVDLTSMILGIGKNKGLIEFRVREDAVVACTEEAVRVFQKLGIKVVECLDSGTYVSKGTLILSGEGNAEGLHIAWKTCLNILEYCCGIATNTKILIDKVKSVDSDISIVATRKSFPGTKEFVIKSAIAGGALPHRLGLSETVLIFKQHVCFLEDIDRIVSLMSQIKNRACEKKVIVEVENLDDALKIAKSGADGIQFDKIPVKDLSDYVKKVRELNPNITLVTAGGINQNNIEQYASTGVNAIATSAIFHGKPLDIEAKMISLI